MKPYVILSPESQKPVPLEVVTQAGFALWEQAQTDTLRHWLARIGFKGKSGKFALLPAADGTLEKVVAVTEDAPDMWSLAHLPAALPEGEYTLQGDAVAQMPEDVALGWQLATYRFTRYKEPKTSGFATLVLPDTANVDTLLTLAEGVFLARDLINRPANDLTPYALAEEAEALAKRHKAGFTVIRDAALLEQNYPLIHTVGRASDNRPCLIDLRWGQEAHPLVTLVGKGVCFDSGGLDIKPPSGMLLMKKDMGGAANVLALAHAVMAAELPVRLRVLIPAVENSVSANAFRPGDIIRSRKGLTVEIGNTDAEGRLVLCDALTEADREKPELLVDFATLTGAARVALGTEVPAFFTDDGELAEELANASAQHHDPLWRLPLWKGYREQLNSDVADLNNAPGGGFGGAITAALYLKEFVEQAQSWVHIDLMAWNNTNKPGRPKGGEAMGIRAVFALLCNRYGKSA